MQNVEGYSNKVEECEVESMKDRYRGERETRRGVCSGGGFEILKCQVMHQADVVVRSFVVRGADEGGIRRY